MTDQVPDRMMFDGRLWSVIEWESDAPDVPTDQELGIRPIMVSTANWSGRIDVFQVVRKQLFLFKVEAEIPDEDHDLIPDGARKEVQFTYEPDGDDGNNARCIIHRPQRRDFFVFDDLGLDYTGSVVLEHSPWDPWDLPRPLSPLDWEPIYRATLRFENGMLVNAVIDELDGQEIEP